MVRAVAVVCAGFFATQAVMPRTALHKVDDGPSYAADGKLMPPVKYREFVYLTSGFNMSYDPNPQESSEGKFDNVFVNPEAYRSFQQSGHWPEGTELVLENRKAETARSINRAGRTQSPELTGLEVHVLDHAHADAKSDGWTFYGFDGEKPAAAIPRTADCYKCHTDHAAVDTTFVQFYPTLLPTAEKYGTLSTEYMRELRTPR